LKKIFYSFLVFFIVLILAIFFAANSSFVIKKAADQFAPDYKISYDDITGNVFTGVKISGLKFDNKTLTKNIKFSWNPSKILYKRVAINEISVDALDVDVVKALIASFPKSDDNSTSESLPIVVLVDKVHLSVNPFVERGILISKTVLDVENVTYASDELSIDNIGLQVDTNITNLLLKASLEDSKLIIEDLSVKDIDSVALEKMFLPKEHNNSTTETVQSEEPKKEEPLNPLIPSQLELKDLMVSLKAREYKSAKIEKLEVTIHDLNADVAKLITSGKNALAIDNYTLLFESNVGHIDIAGNMKEERVTLDHVTLKDIDTLALQELVPSDNNESNVTQSETVDSVEENSTEPKEVNHLIPKYVVINTFHTDVLPATYDPVHILKLVLDVKDIKLNVEKLLVESASIDLEGTTNLSNFKHSGQIKNNHLTGKIKLAPNKELFELYKLPIRKEAIGDIVIDLNASEQQVVANVKAKAKHLLISQKSDTNSSDSNASKEFNVDIDSLLSHVVYTIKGNKLNADTKIMVTTPYAKDISVTNTFVMDGNMSYKGAIKAKELIGIDAKFTKPVQNLNISYTGDAKSAQVGILSDGLKGYFNSDDFKKGQFHLETTKSIIVRDMVELPAELNGTKVNAIVDVPLDFTAIIPLKVKVKILSNVTNLDADIMYTKILQAKVTSTIPEESLLKLFDKNIKWNAINPLVINAQLNEKDLDLKLKSKELSTDVKYFLDDGKVDGKIMLGGLVTDVKGIAQKKITINTKVNSVKSLFNSVQSFYVLETLPPVEGALNLSMDVTQMKQVDLTLTSPKLIYSPDRKTDHIINDVKVVLNADKSQLVLKSYQVTYDKMKFFATKPSTVSLKDTTVTISPLWLNDELKVVGEYNLKIKQGKVDAQADKLHFAHEIIDLDSNIDIKTVLDANKTSVNGKVILLGGNIHYDLGAKTYPSDSDIIIIQEMKKEEASPFMDNLSMLIDVTTKKPLIYKQGPIDIQAKVDLDIHKAEHSELMVLGEVVIVKGGSYTFEGKKFVLDKSNIYFTGNPNKPLLDISVKYKSLNHLITIGISGTPATPNITFSSAPSLNKEQILSIILFDSEAGAGTNSGEDMMKMMGGAMAKSALSDLGIKLDHLAIGSEGSVEVGKKITDEITFIYVNDEVPQVRVKYQHSPHWESVISADEESESYDIVFKRDF